MKVMLLDDCKIDTNKYVYKKGQIIEVHESKNIKHSYYVCGESYTYTDWIPKEICEIIE